MVKILSLTKSLSQKLIVIILASYFWISKKTMQFFRLFSLSYWMSQLTCINWALYIQNYGRQCKSTERIKYEVLALMWWPIWCREMLSLMEWLAEHHRMAWEVSSTPEWFRLSKKRPVREKHAKFSNWSSLNYSNCHFFSWCEYSLTISIKVVVIKKDFL